MRRTALFLGLAGAMAAALTVLAQSGEPDIKRPRTGSGELPPLRFVAVRTRPARFSNRSLCSLPRSRAPAKPLPISNPFVAGSDSIAAPRASGDIGTPPERALITLSKCG